MRNGIVQTNGVLVMINNKTKPPDCDNYIKIKPQTSIDLKLQQVKSITTSFSLSFVDNLFHYFTHYSSGLKLLGGPHCEYYFMADRILWKG